MGTSTLEIPTRDGVADAYLANPGDGARRPGVLLLMDAYGLRPRIQDMAERIAARGYAVLAPNVPYRAGRAPVLPIPDFSRDGARAEFFATARPLMAELSPERMAVDGGAYLDALAGLAPATATRWPTRRCTTSRRVSGTSRRCSSSWAGRSRAEIESRGDRI